MVYFIYRLFYCPALLLSTSNYTAENPHPNFLKFIRESSLTQEVSEVECFTCMRFKSRIVPNLSALTEMKEGIYTKWLKDEMKLYEKHLKDPNRHGRKSLLANL